MATALTEGLRELGDKAARFAQREVAPRKDLDALQVVPMEIWHKMAEQGLLGVGLPVSYHGGGQGYPGVAVAGEALVAWGHNLGLGLSWLIHQVVARFLVLGFGNPGQREAFLPGMARGELTGSIAVSEPGTGAHPKFMKTRALARDGGYVLNGEKAYLTNGPMADLFVVVAVTREGGDRRGFSAFLVPRDAPGLEVTGPMELGFLRPSPHGGLRLRDCYVPASAVLGEQHAAYEEMVKPFRGVEDALMMGPIAGALSRRLALFLTLVREGESRLEDPAAEDLGLYQGLIHCLRVLAYEGAAMLEDTGRHPEFLSLLTASRFLYKRGGSVWERLMQSGGVEECVELDRLSRDIDRLTGIGENVARYKRIKIGRELLARGKYHDKISQP